jgi:hypothetical protein
MRTFSSITLVAVAILLAVVSPGYAQGMSGHGMGGEHHGERGGHQDGDHDGDHDGGRSHFRGPLVYWNYYPYYDSSSPGYWYYCPSAQAYYPYVAYCPDPWVPVLAQ